MSNRPSGYTLVELLVAISLLGLMLGAVGTTFQVVGRLSGHMRQQFAHDVMLSRFCAQFYEDVHRAEMAHLDTPPAAATNAVLRLAVPGDESVRYEIVDVCCLLRTVYRGNTLVGRERYSFPDEARLRLELEPFEGSLLVRVVMDRTVSQPDEDTERLRPGQRLEAILKVRQTRRQ